MKKILFYAIFLQPLLYIITRFFNSEILIKLIDNLSIICIILCCFLLIIKKFKLIDFICFFILNVILMYNMVLNFSKYSIFDFKNLLLLCCISITFTNNEFVTEFSNFIIKHLIYLELNIIISLMIIFITIFSGSGLQNSWGVITLMGPFGLQHALAYYLIILFCISDFIYKKINTKIFLLLKYLVMAMIFFTAVRSATLAIIIIYIYGILKNKRFQIESLVIIPLLIVLFVANKNLYKYIPVLGKNINTSHGGDISNGRFAIWMSLIKYFRKIDIHNKLLGSGAAITYNLNGLFYKTFIQAHNDFLNVLLCYGIVCLLIYLFILLKYLNVKNGLIILIVFIILSATNGLYLYYNFVIMIPFILVYFQLLQSKKPLNFGK